MKRSLNSISTTLPMVILTATLAVACAKGKKASQAPTPAPGSDSSSSESANPDGSAANVAALYGTDPDRDGVPCQRLKGTWITQNAKVPEDRRVITISQSACESATLATGEQGQGASLLQTYETDGEKRERSSARSYRARYRKGALVITEVELSPGGDLSDCRPATEELDSPACRVIERVYQRDTTDANAITVTETGAEYDDNGKSLTRTVTYRAGVNHVPTPSPTQPSPTHSPGPAHGGTWNNSNDPGCRSHYDPNNPYCG